MNPQFEHSNRLIKLLPQVAALGMQTFDRLCCLAQCAFDVQTLPGDACEFGCNAGGTARWLRGLLPDTKLWLYDTFTGHPSDGEKNTYKRGDMKASCPIDIPYSTVVTGNILELSQASSNVPQNIILAHVDLDDYQGTLHALNLVWPRLHSKGVVIVDDVHDPLYPGAKRAVEEFTASQSLNYKSDYGCAGQLRVSVMIRP